MARTEKEFLNTMETYIKITQDRLKDGRIIDAHDELGTMLKMTQQRLREVEGDAPWEEIKQRYEKAVKSHPWASTRSLAQMVEDQAAANETAEKMLREPYEKEENK